MKNKHSSLNSPRERIAAWPEQMLLEHMASQAARRDKFEFARDGWFFSPHDGISLNLPFSNSITFKDVFDQEVSSARFDCFFWRVVAILGVLLVSHFLASPIDQKQPLMTFPEALGVWGLILTSLWGLADFDPEPRRVDVCSQKD